MKMYKLIGKILMFHFVIKVAFSYVEVGLDAELYCNDLGECRNIISNPIEKYVLYGIFQMSRSSVRFMQCNVRYFPSNVFETFQFITSADFSKSNIKYFTKGDFAGAHYLTQLNLKDNEIETFDPDLFEPIQQLDEIDISGNNFKNIFNTTFGVKSPRIIIAKNNQIEYVDAGVVRENLEEIYLNDNKIKILKNFGKTSEVNLKVVDLSNNPLTDLSPIRSVELFINNTTLSSYTCDSERLHANSCQLQSISFVTNNKTTELYLSNNLLSDISNITKVSSIFILDLSVNPIKFDKSRMFENLYLLEYLNLSRTGLNRLEYDTFWNMNNVYILDLSYNKLDNLDADRLYPLKSLMKLYLDGNNIGIMYYDNFRPYNTPYFKEIGLTGNPWGCHNLLRMVQYFVNRNIETPLASNYKLDKKQNIAGIGCH